MLDDLVSIGGERKTREKTRAGDRATIYRDKQGPGLEGRKAPKTDLMEF